MESNDVALLLRYGYIIDDDLQQRFVAYKHLQQMIRMLPSNDEEYRAVLLTLHKLFEDFATFDGSALVTKLKSDDNLRQLVVSLRVPEMFIVHLLAFEAIVNAYTRL